MIFARVCLPNDAALRADAGAAAAVVRAESFGEECFRVGDLSDSSGAICNAHDSSAGLPSEADELRDPLLSLSGGVNVLGSSVNVLERVQSAGTASV